MRSLIDAHHAAVQWTIWPMPQIEINHVYNQLFNGDRLRDDVRYFETYGGRRSGKSYDVVQVICLTILREPRHFVAAIRKVGATLKDSIFAEYYDFFRRNDIPVQVNKTDKEITLPNGSRIRCFGLDDPDKLKSLKGTTIVHFEEANEVTESDFDSVDAGLSPVEYPGRIFLTHNPVPQIPNATHWIQKRFLNVEHPISVAVVNEKANALILRTWYKDNAFCPDATKKILEGYKETNPELYKLWALGEFTKLEGAIFDRWEIANVPSNAKSIGYGLDFGFSSDPAVIVEVFETEDARYFDEILYRTGLTNPDLSEAMKEYGIGKYSEIIADSAEPKSIEELFRMGWNIRACVKGPDSVRFGINAMKTKKIFVTPRSANLQREFSSYCWKQDKNGNMLPEPVDMFNHGIDAIRYRVGLGKNKVSFVI